MVVKFSLPASISNLLSARNDLRAHYQKLLLDLGSEIDLDFTLDGNLIGDIGEALAVELFGIRLVKSKSAEGIDGYAPDGRMVQVKATGTGRGPAFRNTKVRAEHLLFFDLDFENCSGTVVFNGPEHYVTDKLPKHFTNQRSLTAKQIRCSDTLVQSSERLPMFTQLRMRD